MVQSYSKPLELNETCSYRGFFAQPWVVITATPRLASKDEAQLQWRTAVPLGIVFYH